VLQLRTLGGRGHGDERGCSAPGLRVNLHGGGIGQVFPAARDRGLDESPGEQAHAAGDENAERDDLDAAAALPRLRPRMMRRRDR
jgi:hypothetical protein